MSNYFYLTLDTTAPANPSIEIAGGATYTVQQLVTCAIATSDSDKTGYQMLIWGDVDETNNPNIKKTEETSTWVTFAATQQVKLSATDGNKTVCLKIRDAVHNVSAQASDSIILDSDIPEATISGPDVSVISKITGKDEATFTFQVDEDFVEYKIKVVGTTGAAHDSGAAIPTAGGSSNMSGSAGNYPADTAINCKIKGADLETASSGDGQKIVKVFVKDKAGNWSA